MMPKTKYSDGLDLKYLEKLFYERTDVIKNMTARVVNVTNSDVSEAPLLVNGLHHLISFWKKIAKQA